MYSQRSTEPLFRFKFLQLVITLAFISFLYFRILTEIFIHQTEIR